MAHIKLGVSARCAMAICALAAFRAAAGWGANDTAGAGHGAAMSTEPIITLIAVEGTAPFSVHAHALESELSEGTPLTAEYFWDFGDPGGTYNHLRGFVASHVYDAPGVYRVSLVVTEEGGLAGHAQATITVLPDERQALYVAESGDDDNSGLTPDDAFQTITHGVEMLQDDMVLLLRRGDVIESDETSLLAASNVRIAAFGFGSRPIVRWTGDLGYCPIIKVCGDGRSDITIQDLAFESIYDVSQYHDVVDAIQPVGRNVTVRNCAFCSVTIAVNGNRSPEGLLILDNQAQEIGSYFCWGQGTDCSIIGNEVDGSFWEHNIRLGGAERVLIAGNRLTNDPKRTIWAMLGSWCYICGNEASEGRVSVGPDPYYGGPDDRFEWVVVEANQMSKDSDSNATLELLPGAEHVMARNNIIEATGIPVVSVAGYDEQSQRTNRDIQIINNTGINFNPIGRFAEVRAGGEDLLFVNNLYSAPELVTGAHRTANFFVEAEDLSSFIAIHNNVWAIPAAFDWVPEAYHYLWPYWADAQGYLTPGQWGALDQVWDEGYEVVVLDERFAPVDGSLAADHGIPVAGVRADYHGQRRPASRWSAGAVEVNPAGPYASADINQDGMVDFDDLLEVLWQWGPCPAPPDPCPADLTSDGDVNLEDFFVILANWT